MIHIFFNSSKKSCSEGGSGCSRDKLSWKGGTWIWLFWESDGSSIIEMLVFSGLSFLISSIISGESLERIFHDLKWISYTKEIAYVGKVVSSVWYTCLSTLLFGFATRWYANCVGFGRGWLEGNWSCWGWGLG